MLHESGTSERAIVGPNLPAGQRVQLLIPGNTFHTARVIGQRRWFLGASTEWPAVEKLDVDIDDVEALAATYPDVADDLRVFDGKAIDFTRPTRRLSSKEFGRAQLPGAPNSSGRPAATAGSVPRKRLNAMRGTLTLPSWQNENAQAN